MKGIVDTGLIVGLLFRNDPYHDWRVRSEDIGYTF